MICQFTESLCNDAHWPDVDTLIITVCAAVAPNRTTFDELELTLQAGLTPCLTLSHLPGNVEAAGRVRKQVLTLLVKMIKELARLLTVVVLTLEITTGDPVETGPPVRRLTKVTCPEEPVTALNAAAMSVKLAFHVADAIVWPDVAVSEPVGAV